METPLNQTYWDERWQTGATGWDIGHPAPALVDFVMTSVDREANILLPGAGSAHEALQLYAAGYHNLHVLDISATAIERFKNRFPEFPANQVHCEDFFAHKGAYDVILEQTFFCALDPQLRGAYVEKMHQLLQPRGVLAGVLFSVVFDVPGPPFGGIPAHYVPLFAPYFVLKKFEPCTNSIAPRAGREYFIKFEKKIYL